MDTDGQNGQKWPIVSASTSGFSDGLTILTVKKLNFWRDTHNMSKRRMITRKERNAALLDALARLGTATREELLSTTALQPHQLSDAILEMGMAGAVELVEPEREKYRRGRAADVTAKRDRGGIDRFFDGRKWQKMARNRAVCGCA